MQKVSSLENVAAHVPQLLTIDAVATMMRVSRPTVYAYMRAGLPFIKLGRNLRFALPSLQQWISEHERSL